MLCTRGSPTSLGCAVGPEVPRLPGARHWCLAQRVGERAPGGRTLLGLLATRVGARASLGVRGSVPRGLRVPSPAAAEARAWDPGVAEAPPLPVTSAGVTHGHSLPPRVQLGPGAPAHAHGTVSGPPLPSGTGLRCRTAIASVQFIEYLLNTAPVLSTEGSQTDPGRPSSWEYKSSQGNPQTGI